MMRNHPRLIFNPIKYRENVSVILKHLKLHNINAYIVTKVFCAYKPMVDAVADLEIDGLADSRLENIEQMGNPKVSKVLLRLPDPNEADWVVQISDISLNSEWDTILALNTAASRVKKVHKIILMVEMGDLREGVLEDDVMNIMDKITELSSIECIGLGANFSCYGGIMASSENLQKLVDLASRVKQNFNISEFVISGGNSSSLYLLDNGQMPKGINNLRLGESVVLGRETAFGEPIAGLHRDVVQLEATIVELKEKASYPIGKRGMDAFGEVPYIEDKGNMLRGILAIGKQDVDIRGLFPVDDQIVIIGGSSDHLIVEVLCSDYKVGDKVIFNLNYSGLLRASTSPYVKKVIVDKP